MLGSQSLCDDVCALSISTGTFTNLSIIRLVDFILLLKCACLLYFYYINTIFALMVLCVTPSVTIIKIMRNISIYIVISIIYHILSPC